jgi:hypothetical protein
MKSPSRFAGADLVAGVPLVFTAVLLLFGLVGFLQVGHWPSHFRPDPQHLTIFGAQVGGFMLLFVLFAAIPLTALAAAAIAMNALLHALGDFVEGKWNFEIQQRNLTRVALAAVGTLLFSVQCGATLNWLSD